MTYRFHELADDDEALMRQLNALFGEAFADAPTYEHVPPSDAYLRNLLVLPHIIVLVALKNDYVVGGLVAYELKKFEQARSEIYIYDLAVSQAHRRCGIATGLIRALQDIAKVRGAWVIFVQADYGDEPAIKLYESLGVREQVLHFDISV